MARLNEKKRAKILRRLKAEESVAAVARSEGVGYQTVWRLKHGKSRAKPGPRKIYRILTKKEREEVKVLRNEGWTLSRIAKHYDASESAVCRVVNDVSKPHVGAM